MSDPTFAQLLTHHMQRAGISDSELARAIGVQRQTVFRWKEGLVSRPRVREDLLQIAQKLRLTPVERDQLLLAAGFPPEDRALVGQPSVSAPPEQAMAPVAMPLLDAHMAVGTDNGAAHESVVEPVSDVPVTPPRAEQRSGRPRLGWRTVAGLFVGLGLVLGGGLALRPWLPLPTPVPPTPTVQTPVLQFPTAGAGETLLLVAQFTGYTDQQFNVAGRIADELAREIDHAGLVSTTVALWPAPIHGLNNAQGALSQAGAALIIWGEYDSGRIRANLTLSDQLLTQSVDFDLTSADELVTTINDKVPAEVRMFALLTLGTLYPLDEFYTRAARTFQAALDLRPPQQKTRALLNFYIGLAVSRGGTLDAYADAIAHYSEALQLNPHLYDARYNRGTLWLTRSYWLTVGSPEIGTSLDAAIDDLTQTLHDRPSYANAYLNRGIAYYERRGPDDLSQAIADFDRFIQLQPHEPRGYYHRALAKIRDRRDAEWVADLQQTLVISPTYGAAYNTLCWGHALAQQPETALPYCDQAYALDRSGANRDGRGMALAQLGQYAEASRELKAYLAWLRTLRPTTFYERFHGPQIVQWIRALEAQQNPFDQATLDALR
jgi:tetratricopeptide (TPR) repeat protein/transcriptional regulator with XRE-family HTH domain